MSRDFVVRLLEMTWSNAELIARAYQEKEVVKSDDNWRNVEALQQCKVLVPRGNDIYSLHTAFRVFLDGVLRIERLYGEASDVGAAFQRLNTLLNSLSCIAHEDTTQDREKLEDEILQSIYGISDSIQKELSELRTLVENRFASVRSLAEKRRQNEYYVSRTEKTIRALELFVAERMTERVEFDSAFVKIVRSFRLNLTDRMPIFLNELLEILAILKRYLFDYRKIEERTRRVRRIWLHLERHAGHEWQAWDESAHPPSWLCKSPGFALRCHPAVRDSAHADILAEIARDIPASKFRAPVERPRGRLLEGDPPETVLLAPKAHQKALQELIKACKIGGSRISALAWHASQDSLSALTAAVWLQYVLEILGPRRRGRLGVNVTVEESRDAVFNGNVRVHDVFVEAATLES